jgi:hypothetical protein
MTIKICNCPTRFDTTFVSSSGTLLKAQFSNGVTVKVHNYVSSS